MIKKYIKSQNFFPKYARKIKEPLKKVRGYDSQQKPMEFSPEEQQQIGKGLVHMAADYFAIIGDEKILKKLRKIFD